MKFLLLYLFIIHLAIVFGHPEKNNGIVRSASLNPWKSKFEAQIDEPADHPSNEPKLHSSTVKDKRHRLISLEIGIIANDLEKDEEDRRRAIKSVIKRQLPEKSDKEADEMVDMYMNAVNYNYKTISGTNPSSEFMEVVKAHFRDTRERLKKLIERIRSET